MTQCEVEIIDRGKKKCLDEFNISEWGVKQDSNAWSGKQMSKEQNISIHDDVRKINCSNKFQVDNVQRQKSSIPSKNMYTSNLTCHKKSSQLTFILFTLILLSLPSLTQSYTLSISSSEPYTGVASTYYFTFQNHNNPTNLVFTFSTWSPNLDQPFTTSYRIMDNTTGNSLSCTKRFNLIIECNLTAAIFIGGSYPSTIILKMTNIFNPSSLKPYPITVFMNSSLSSQTQTANLTIFLPRQSSIFIDNYSSTIGQKSSSLLYLDFKNFLTSSTVLTLTYNSSLVTIDMLSDSSYSIGTDVAGTKKLTGWNPATQMLKTLKINITNPSVAVAFTIEGMLAFTENGVEYKIESYSIIIQPTALAYTSVGTSSTTSNNKLYMGLTTNTLSLFAQCSIATINSPTKNSYFQLTYDNTLITISNLSNCIASTTNGTVSTCTVSIPSNVANANNTFQWTNIYSLISTSSIISNVSVKVKSWSYFSPMTQFYAVCESLLIIDVVPQVILPTVNLGGCLQGVGAENSLTVNFVIENAIAADVLGLKLSSGQIINKTGSLPITYNSSSLQYQSLITSTHFTTPTTLQLPLTITNPTFIPSQQPSITITLYRKLSSPNNNISPNIYGQTSIPLNLCPVTIQKSSSNSLLTLSSSSTYMSNVVYYVQLRSGAMQLKDYGVNDFIVVNFKSKVTNTTVIAETDSPFQLSPFNTNNSSISSPLVTLNSQYNLPAQKVSASKLKITLNSSSIVNLINTQGVSSLFLAIKSLTNPYFISDTYCIIETYYYSVSSTSGLLKQTLTTSTVPIKISTNYELSISTTSSTVITALQTNNTISLQITSNTNKLLLSTTSYSFITQLYIVIKMPFSCSNTNATNQILVPMASINASVISVMLTQCDVGYFQDYTLNVQVKEYARFTHSSLTVSYLPTTSTSLAIKTTCGDQCHLCDPTTLKCLKCFNSTHNLFNYLYPSSGKCYQTCPNKTFGNGFTCEDCHEICQSCVSSLYSSCTKCSQNFVNNSLGMCQSTCGSGKYLDDQQKCESCEPNCSGCINATHCYSCRSGAILIDNMCIFSQCQSPCATCSGSIDNCLTCINPSNSTAYYFYQNKCYQQCPQGTFQWQINSNDPSIQSICKKVQSANVYFVGIVLSVIAFGIGMGIRCFVPKRAKYYKSLANTNNTTGVDKDTNDNNNKLLKRTKLQRKLSQTFNHNNNTNIVNSNINNNNTNTNINTITNNTTNTKLYKLNILRFMTVLMSYIQIVCAVVILIQGGVYNPKGVNEMIVVGLVGLVVTNFVFGLKYYRAVYKKLLIKRKKFVEQNMAMLAARKRIASNNNNKGQQQLQTVKKSQEQKQRQHIIQVQQQIVIDEQQIIVQNSNIMNSNNTHKQQSIDMNNKLNNSNQQQQQQQQQQQSLQPSQYQHHQQQHKQSYKQYKSKLAQFDNQMMRQLFVAILSTIFTLRTYNILRSNLFVVLSNDFSNNNNIIKSNEINGRRQNLQQFSIMGNRRKVSNTYSQQNQQQQVMGSYSALKLPHQLLQSQQQQQQQRPNEPIQLKMTQPSNGINNNNSNNMSKKNSISNKIPLPIKKSSSIIKQTNSNKPFTVSIRETMKLKLNNNNNTNANNITGTQRTGNNSNNNTSSNRNKNISNRNNNNNNINNNNKQSQRSQKQQQLTKSKKLFNVFNNNPHSIYIQPTQINVENNDLNNNNNKLNNNNNPNNPSLQQSPNPLIQYKHQLTTLFYHPFYTYLMLSSLFIVSLMFAISTAILIFNNRYANMMIWGIDGLIVIGVNILLNIFDLWKVVNLNRHQQDSQLSYDQKQYYRGQNSKEINQTMENIHITQQIEFQLNQFGEKIIIKKSKNNNLNGANNDQDDGLQAYNLNQTKKLNNNINSNTRQQIKKPFMPLKITSTMTKNNSNKHNNSDQIDQNDIEIKSKSISSPKSPSYMKSDNKATKVLKSSTTNFKNKRFINKNKNNNSNGQQQQYVDQQPPQLKMFDDLGVEEQDNNHINKNLNKTTRNSQLSKVRSQNDKAFINGRKTQMSMNMLGETVRGSNIINNNNNNNNNSNNSNKMGRNYKLDDIYLGFLQPQQQNQRNQASLLLSTSSANGVSSQLLVVNMNMSNKNTKKQSQQNNNNYINRQQRQQRQYEKQQQQQVDDEIETVKLSSTNGNANNNNNDNNNRQAQLLLPSVQQNDNNNNQQQNDMD